MYKIPPKEARTVAYEMLDGKNVISIIYNARRLFATIPIIDVNFRKTRPFSIKNDMISEDNVGII